MTSRHNFTDEEWTRVRRAPLVAGVATSVAAFRRWLLASPLAAANAGKEGVPVRASGGEEVGTVEHVLQVPELDVFDGLVEYIGWSSLRRCRPGRPDK